VTIDLGWSAQAVTPLDVAAMAATENIVSASQDPDLGKASDRMSTSDVFELSKGKVYDSEDQGFVARASGSLTDESSWKLGPLTATDAGGPQDLTHEYMAVTQLDQAYASSLATASYRDQQYVGSIVDYTA
jgi:hypothetical protein